ncbi:MAG: anthranilate synthase component II [Thermonemataceae bacterium]
MLLLLDNFDSFTYNLVDYFGQLGVRCEVVRNDVPLSKIKQRSYQGIVLSPGPETPQKAGILLDLVDYYHQKLPILGVCLGHQALGTFFGAKLTKAPVPMHGKLSTLVCLQEALLLEGIPKQFEVVRYHSLVLTQLPTTLTPLAVTKDEHRTLMIFKHTTLPIYGIQYHPEAVLTEFGLPLLSNWLQLIC